METQAFTVRLPVDLYQRLRREAFDAHMKQSEIVVWALTRYFASDSPGDADVPPGEETPALCLVAVLAADFHGKLTGVLAAPPRPR